MLKILFKSLGVTLLIGLSAAAGAMSPDVIQSRVQAHVEAAVAERHPNGQAIVNALPLTPTLQNKRCDDLQLNIPQQRLYGRVSVHVRCHAPEVWALYAPVQVDLTLPVVVALRMVPRGERLTRQSVAIEMRPAQQIRSQALTRLEDAVGQAAGRAMRSGQTLNANQLVVPNTIQKGERVTILSGTGRVQIRTYGIALEHGKVGDQIEVRNERSKRVIYPWITGAGAVSTRPPRTLPIAQR